MNFPEACHWLADKYTYCTHTGMYQVCAYFETHYFKHFSHIHKHSDALTQPSMHTCVKILIDSVCATRPLFCLGDAITVLNAYTTVSAHMCVSVCVHTCTGDFYRTHLFIQPAVYITRQITVHLCDRLKLVNT